MGLRVMKKLLLLRDCIVCFMYELNPVQEINLYHDNSLLVEYDIANKLIHII